MRISLNSLAAGLAVCGALPLSAITANAAESADGVLARAERAMGATGLKSLAFSGSGTGATFGQAYVPGNVWPKLNIISLARIMDYGNGAMREESARTRAEPTGGGAVPLMGTGEQRQIVFVDGKHAWNQVGQAMVAAPVALEPRLHDLWTSPHGVLVAAKRNKARLQFKREGGKSLAAVMFTEPGVMTATAFINDDGLVERVEAKHPHPVTGDTTVITEYSDYRDQSGVKFPARIRQSHAGHPTLDLAVKDVQINAATNFAAPEPVRSFAEKVASEKLADGVWYLAGGSHHSVAIEMKDHLVVVEAPLYDARSAAALAEAKKLAPGKPIRTVINSHHHFDHAGGLRTAAAEGATLLVAADAKPYFEKVFANPNRIKPDALAQSGKKAKITGYSGKTVLSDGARNIEIHSIEGSVHSKGFTLVYLPQEKLLIETDAYTPSPPGSAPPAKPNDNHVNLVENIERLKLSVERIAPLHGRVVPLAELYSMVGRKPQ
jgi:glyoxylase-like metal-dependent hydrolase (beta-lactamase superfamily II)